MELNEFGSFIYKRRKELGLTQQDLASLLNVSIPTISKYENNERFPDLSYLGLIARLLKIDLVSLVNQEVKLDNEYDLTNEFNINNFASYFRALRKIKGYTLQTLAVKLDTRYQTISKWEKGESLPSIEQLLKCCELFNVPLYELYYGKDLDKKEVVIKEKNNKINTPSLILSIVSIFIMLVSLVTIIFDDDNINSSSIKTSSTSNEFTNKVIVKYEFNEFLDSISFIIEKGSKIEKYDPHIEGYSIDYYLDDKLFDFNSYINNSITLNGIFTINTYNVTFYDEEKSIINTQNVEYGKSAVAPIVTSKDEKLEFLKWSEDYTFIKKDLDIYPIFINKEADITFDPNGGECVVQYIYDYNSSMFNSLPKATKKGYKFIGWYLDDKLFTKDYEVGNPIVLRAEYTPVEYKITLNSNGGSLDNTVINVLYDDEITLPIPIKESESFEGWFLNNELVPLKFKYNYDYNIELIAKYSIVTNKYVYSEFDDYIELLDYTGDESEIIIPSSINGKPVTTILNKIFDNNKDNIKSIRIPSTLITYNKGIFKNLINLEKLYVPIEAKSNLNELFDGEFPLNLYTLEFYGATEFNVNTYFFNGTNKLFKFLFNEEFSQFNFKYGSNYIKEIEIYKSSKGDITIEGNTLSNLEKVSIYGPVKLFLDFQYCINLSEIIAPKVYGKITDFAFTSCSSLEKFIIPNDIEYIGTGAFHCSGVQELYVNRKLKAVESRAFDGTCIQKVYYEGTLEEWKSIIFEGDTANPLYLGAKLYINNELVTDPSAYPYNL